MFVNLKPVSERSESGQAVIARLRPQLAQVTGLQIFLTPVQDVRAGGRQANSTYQYTLKSDSLPTLRLWATRLAEEMKQAEAMTDVDTDQQDNGVETRVEVDRDSASRLGLSSAGIDSALYNAFGQRQVATIYSELNQYHVIMEWHPRYTQGPNALADLYVPAKGLSSGTSASDLGGERRRDRSRRQRHVVHRPGQSGGARLVDRQRPQQHRHAAGAAGRGRPLRRAGDADVDQPPGRRAGDDDLVQPGRGQDPGRRDRGDQAGRGRHRHARRRCAASFQGTALAAQQSQGQQTFLILAALVVIYIVLGVLYESLVHPITVLSTLPSAGVGAVLALLLLRMEFSIIALIGVFLLIGIVKKNAILIIDFALEAERTRGLSAVEAVREACLLRFRPILMTTLAAALGALPLAIGFGEGAELRQPLGVAIIGGLIASQLLTLLTTPVVYVLLDRLRRTKEVAPWRRRPGRGRLVEAAP